VEESNSKYMKQRELKRSGVFETANDYRQDQDNALDLILLAKKHRGVFTLYLRAKKQNLLPNNGI
jgi:hypothetical protein